MENKGVTNSTIAVAITMVIVLIITSFLFLTYIQQQIKEHQDLIHEQETKFAYKYTTIKTQRDQLKLICDSNLLLSVQKEEWIKQNIKNKKLPPELFGNKPCQTIESKKEE